MTVEFRPLTEEEAQSATHFCNRCGTPQKRFEIHACMPTARWKAAKAKGEIVHPALKQTVRPPKAADLVEKLALPPSAGVKLLGGPEKAKPPAAKKKAAKSKAVNSETAKPVNNKPAVNTKPVNTDPKPVNISEDVNNPVNTDRKAYLREYMRKRRAEAKAAAA
jgi:hypothetical protein